MSDSDKWWLLHTAIRVADVSVWEFLQALELNIGNLHADVFEKDEMKAVLDLMQTTIVRRLVEKALPMIVEYLDRPHMYGTSVRIQACRWLTMLKARGADGVIRYDLPMQCAEHGSFACLNILIYTLGLKQCLLQDATLFMRLLCGSARSVQSYILQVYDVPYYIPERCNRKFDGLDPDYEDLDTEYEDFLLRSQQFFRNDLTNSKNAVLHVSLMHSLGTNRLSKDIIIILKHIFGDETIDTIRYADHVDDFSE
eukprot:6196825-Pleurochrysis_carterae.AAC.1